MDVTEDAARVATWTDQTTAVDRVQSVVSTVSQPRSASYIADEANVPESTARDYLENLVELNVLLKSDCEDTAVYQPNPSHIRAQILEELLDEHDYNELIQLKAGLQEQIKTWRDEYGVTSPEELCERTTDDSAEIQNIQTTVREWKLIAYRLDIVEDAIKDYTTYNHTDIE